MTDPREWSTTTLGYTFGDTSLLERALTHRSAASVHNERLEFLGDAALGLAVAAALFRRKPNADEGDLTRYRALLVRRETLAEVARDIDVGEHLILGAGENRSGGHQRASVLANALEALLGAVYLDGGFASSTDVVERLFGARLDQLPDPDDLKDPKTRLQEYLQSRSVAPPEYGLDDVSGPSHAQTFRAYCRISALDIESTGTGTSRRRAEQDAAGRALVMLRRD